MTMLEDRLAIQDVMTNYAAGVDDRDMAQYRRCFADDVEIVGFGGDSVVGADLWVAEVVEKLAAFGQTQHMLGPQLVQIDGDVASVRTDVQALHYLIDDPETTLILWATYRTNMRREGAVWKIARHELVRRGTRLQKG
jgi:3-phenylpropionate/cinnamic acid dioxygenase small subunit